MWFKKKKALLGIVTKSCAKCVWFEEQSNREHNGETHRSGVCRHASPNPDFPRVCSDDWCGDYE